MSDARLAQLGEDRHALCRWGLLTEAWTGTGESVDDEPPEWTPSVMPICTFPVPEPSPPAMKRQWGGSIDLARDCAVCPAYAPLPRKETP